ncbi:MAG: hypothetical protein ACXABO_04490 [Promethearchaeota archaeon]|jgi:hypothetical protein
MFLDRVKEVPKNRVLIIITLSGFLIVVLIYVLIFIPIEAMVPTYGILDYEFAWTADTVETIFEAWNWEGLEIQKVAIWWDFLFIIGYVSVAFGLIVIVLRRSEVEFQKIWIYVSITPFLTGIFDALENVNLLVLSLDFITQFNAFMASFFALLKFGFLFAAIIYFMLGLVIITFNRIKKRNE